MIIIVNKRCIINFDKITEIEIKYNIHMEKGLYYTIIAKTDESNYVELGNYKTSAIAEKILYEIVTCTKQFYIMPNYKGIKNAKN